MVLRERTPALLPRRPGSKKVARTGKTKALPFAQQRSSTCVEFPFAALSPVLAGIRACKSNRVAFPCAIDLSIHSFMTANYVHSRPRPLGEGRAEGLSVLTVIHDGMLNRHSGIDAACMNIMRLLTVAGAAHAGATIARRVSRLTARRDRRAGTKTATV